MYQNAPSPLQINKAETLLNERNNGAILSHYLDVNYIKSNKNECFMFSVNGCKLFDECHTNPNLRKIIDILREAGMRISNQGIGNEFTLKTLESAILKTNGQIKLYLTEDGIPQILTNLQIDEAEKINQKAEAVLEFLTQTRHLFYYEMIENFIQSGKKCFKQNEFLTENEIENLNNVLVSFDDIKKMLSVYSKKVGGLNFKDENVQKFSNSLIALSMNYQEINEVISRIQNSTDSGIVNSFLLECFPVDKFRSNEDCKKHLDLLCNKLKIINSQYKDAIPFFNEYEKFLQERESYLKIETENAIINDFEGWLMISEMNENEICNYHTSLNNEQNKNTILGCIADKKDRKKSPICAFCKFYFSLQGS